MTEKLLQFIWRFQYFNRSGLQTIDGEALEILFPGQLNSVQGPDFLQARIRIGNTLMAGSVELHLQTSYWNRHRHNTDANYQNVVLHVVFCHDKQCGSLPVLELQPRISTLLLDRYERLMQSASFIACNNNISQVPALTWASWVDRLLAERLQRKAAHLLNPIAENKMHWEEGLWHLLARSFGGKTNADAFEAVACSLSLKVLGRHKNNLLQLEALLMGQARLLSPSFQDEYAKMLLREYRFMQQKYGLTPISLPIHFLRMRPPNFPTVRMAQLAALLFQSTHLFSKVLEPEDESIEELFQATANDYWHYHYRFDEAAAFQPKKIGADMLHHILINAVVPVLFAYGSFHRQSQYTERAISILEQLPAEKNAVSKGFGKLGVKSRNAAESQSVLELKNNYCNERRCLECAVGSTLLKREMAEHTTESGRV